MVKGFLPKHTAAKKRGNAGEKELRSLVRRNIVCVGTGCRGLFTVSLKRRAAEPRWPCISITGFGEIVKENGGKSGRPRAIGCKKGWSGEHARTKGRGLAKGEIHFTSAKEFDRPGELGCEKGRPGESAGAKGEGRRKERGVQKAKRPTKGAIHSKSEEGRQRERVIAHGAKEFGRPVGRLGAEKDPGWGRRGEKKGWANRGGGVRKKGGWGRCYVGGRRKGEHYKAKDGNCNFLSLSLLL